MTIQCIILARGGSKGIKDKNIIDFCDKPLIAWTIQQCKNSKNIDKVWVSSDSKKILDISKSHGAEIIQRPKEISLDVSTSEQGWAHAIEYLEKKKINIELILAPQVTSPLRETYDIDNAINKFKLEKYDSMFSANKVEDLFFWEHDKYKKLKSINYDYLSRKRRQDISPQIVENGSFYLFKPNVIKKFNNRFGDKIGFSEMAFWKMFEIDNIDDIKLCSLLMREYLLKK